MHLYTEPESRGRGLAGWVARALVGGLVGGGRGKGDGEGKSRGEKGEGGEDGKGWFEGVEQKDAWVASDVGVGNRGSERVAEGLGGRMGWRVRWLGVDLGKVRGIVEGMEGEGGRGEEGTLIPQPDANIISTTQLHDSLRPYLLYRNASRSRCNNRLPSTIVAPILLNTHAKAMPLVSLAREKPIESDQPNPI